MRLDGQPTRRKGPRDAERTASPSSTRSSTSSAISPSPRTCSSPASRKLGRRPALHRSPRGCAAARGELLAAVDLDLSPTTPVSRLSQGERQLVEIAKALGGQGAHHHLRRADDLADHAARRSGSSTSSSGCRRQGIAIIYISHILGDVLRLCDDIVVLRDGARGRRRAEAEMTIETHDLADGRPRASTSSSRRARRRAGGGAPVLEVRGRQPARHRQGHHLRAAAGRGARHLRPDGRRALRAGAHPLRPRPLRARRRSSIDGDADRGADAPAPAWTAAWPSSPRIAASKA